jgi:NAD-dependent deacetylase
LNFGDFDEIKINCVHIVWFGEEVPALEEAVSITETADYFAVIGTSFHAILRLDLIDLQS